MKRALRRAIAGLAAFLLLGVAGGGLAALWLWSRLPQTRGTLTLPGLEGPVEILRDAWGVPHIYAGSLPDLAFAQGFVTAQDRLWQMDFFRRVAAGRVAEVFGPEALGWDRIARTVGFERAARRVLRTQDPEARRWLEAYARGVNAAIGRTPRPLEFLLLRYRPAPWEPLHTLALGRLLAWELSQWRPRLVLAELLPRLDRARREDLVPAYPEDGPVIVAAAGASSVTALGLLGVSGGSNSWVVGPGRSATGAPLLANDPHLPLGAPSRWYEVHLVGAGLDVYGFSIPGVPGVITGANADLAWGLTNLMLDDLDLYRERLHPERDLYEVEGRWEPLTVLMERIEVKGHRPERLEVRLSRHGPLITPTLIRASEPLALRWTGHDPGEEVTALLGMNRARTWAEFRAALRLFGSPAQSVVYADRTGVIAYQAIGRIPVRPHGGSLVPLEGWHGRDDWQGWVPFDRLPHAVNPPGGILVTANNRVTADPGLYISHLWEPPDRAARIRELLDAGTKLTLEDFRAIQLDRRPPWVRRLIPEILKAWEGKESGEVAGALELLRRWDGALGPESAAAALFETTVEELMARTFRDELGEADYREFGEAWDLAGVVLDRLLARGTSPWFDDVTTPEREDLPTLLRQSLRAAVGKLSARLGPDPGRWRWGRLHTVIFEHPLGRRRPLDRLFSLGPYGTGGDGRSVWKSQFPHDGRFRATVGPSFRMLVDLGDRRRSRVILTTGQSGHVLSRHYRDQAPLWLTGEDRPMLVEREAIERTAQGRLRLIPTE